MGHIIERIQHGQGTAHDVELLDSVADRAPITANRTLAALRKLGNWAVNRDILETSFCSGVKAPSPERSRARVLCDDEICLL